MINYEVSVVTGDVRAAGTNAKVFMQIYGETGKTELIILENRSNNFERGATDIFKVWWRQSLLLLWGERYDKPIQIYSKNNCPNHQSIWLQKKMPGLLASADFYIFLRSSVFHGVTFIFSGTDSKGVIEKQSSSCFCLPFLSKRDTYVRFQKIVNLHFVPDHMLLSLYLSSQEEGNKI